MDLYEEIKERELKGKLDSIGPFRYGHLFAVIVLSQFVLIWSFKGPIGTGLWSNLLLGVVVDVVVLVGVYNFLVGITFLRDLLKGACETEDGVALEPSYLPFHPDRRGGYADIGKLAMRINLIVILVGAYYAYRAYISGIRTFPQSSDLSFTPLYADLVGIEQTQTLEMVFWVINYLGPVVLYVLVVSVWFYFTFWEFHRNMKKQKKDLILRQQSKRRADAETSTERPLPLGDFEDRADWQALYNAPEWPIDTRRLGGLITANFAPVVLAVLTVLPDLLAAWR
jgi:hypothetical protein